MALLRVWEKLAELEGKKEQFLDGPVIEERQDEYVQVK